MRGRLIRLPPRTLSGLAGRTGGAHGSEVNRLTGTGNFFPFVRREGIWTGFFFFHSAQVIGPSGVCTMVSSVDMGLSLCGSPRA